jgi:hypothetical protein
VGRQHHQGPSLEKLIGVSDSPQRDFAPNYDSIPPHGRWQHFDVGGNQRVAKLLALWPDPQVDAKERTRRLIDMFLVSVLLDAGAGVKWTYTSKENGRRYTRSEGLAVASLEMFRSGAFSGDMGQPFQVDAAGLKGLTPASLADGLQVTADNPIAGLEGRAELLVRLGHALEANRQIFGATARPGNMIGMLPRVLPPAMTNWKTTSSRTRPRAAAPSRPSTRRRSGTRS